MTLPKPFLELSARIGSDPLQIQGPGGNTSIKRDGTMHVKASGTELADALREPIFVAVDVAKARAELRGAGDGTCRAAMVDPNSPVRPSIETTFHAMLDASVVVHTHSVSALAHLTSHEGTVAAERKLAGLSFASVPYAQPGLPLAREIEDRMTPDTRVFLLRNHGLIVTGDDASEAGALLDEVEDRLALDARSEPTVATLVADDRADASYWPDHVVFLGPGLPAVPPDGANARAMLRCLADVLARVDPEWIMQPLGADDVAALMNWDAETYRQAVAKQAR